WVTLCPAHDDRNPSLSITEGDDGRLLLLCHAGCSQEAVIEAVARKGVRIGPPRNGARGPADDGGNIASLQRKGFRIVTAYPYQDEHGHLLYEKVRLEKGHNGTREKTFRQRRPDGEG